MWVCIFITARNSLIKNDMMKLFLVNIEMIIDKYNWLVRVEKVIDEINPDSAICI